MSTDCKHIQHPRNKFLCELCGDAVFFFCNRCREVTVNQEVKTKRVFGRSIEYGVPLENCPHCNRIMWEVASFNDAQGSLFPKHTRTTSGTYRALIKANGAKPGKKIVSGAPLTGKGPDVIVTLIGQAPMSWEAFAEKEGIKLK